MPGRLVLGWHGLAWPVDALSAFILNDVLTPVSLAFNPKRTTAMLRSHVINIDGAFVGASVRLNKGCRFIAADMKLDDLDGSIFPTLADVQRLASRIYIDECVTTFALTH
jgi:hypothetical protein